MQLDLLSKKKFPRLFLAMKDGVDSALQGVQFVWPDRSTSAILDMSYAGIAIASAVDDGGGNLKRLTKIKLGDSLDGKIRLEASGEAIPLKLRVVKLTSNSIGFVINTMSASGRLMMEQTAKDTLVLKNIRKISSAHLHATLNADLWFHGPFDSNIFIWNSSANSVSKIVLEYDNLLLTYDNGKVILQKSMAASDEERGYEAPLLEPSGNVSMGASWLDRLIKLIGQIEDDSGKLSFVANILRLQRPN